MNKKFYRYSGTEFFEKYLLPTNPHSRTRIFAYLAEKRAESDTLTLAGSGNLQEKLKKRVFSANRYIKSHILGGIAHQTMTVSLFSSAVEIGVVSTLANVLINGYPILVQMHIRDRCNKLLERKEN